MGKHHRPHSADEHGRDLAREVEDRLDEGDIAGAQSLLHDEPAADVADTIEDLDSEEKVRIFGALSSETAAAVLSELGPTDVQAIADSLPDAIARAATEMQLDEVADLLDLLPPAQRADVLRGLPREDAAKARGLLQHAPDTAGGIMTPDFVLLAGDITAGSAIQITQQSLESETIAHLFVCDEQERLLGHLPLHRLVFAHPERRLRELLDAEVATVTPATDREEVVRLAIKYDLAVVAVVDAAGRMVGAITGDDILEAGQHEADEDMYRLAGTAERNPVHTSVLRSARLRLPWLLLTLLGGVCIALLMSRFGDTLADVRIAFFIPLIPLMGGNVAIQASTIVVRGLAVGDIRPGRHGLFVVRQWAVSMLMAVCCGTTAGLLALLLPVAGGQMWLVVGISVGLAITLAGTLGTVLPLAFARAGFDPAVSAGPFVTIINDLLCITIYLSLSTALLTG